MNCRQVHEIIEEYYEGVLSVGDELGVDIHLVQCKSCDHELGGIQDIVEDCNQAFDQLMPNEDFASIQDGIKDMYQRELQQTKWRDMFHAKDKVFHLIFFLVAIPTIWLVSAKAIETYSAYTDLVPDSSIESPEIKTTDPGTMDIPVNTKHFDFLNW